MTDAREIAQQVLDVCEVNITDIGKRDAVFRIISAEVERLRMSIRGYMEDKAVMADRVADQDLQIDELQRRLDACKCQLLPVNEEAEKGIDSVVAQIYADEAIKQIEG